MRAEGETLFVECKADIGRGEGFQIAKAVSAFANTLGGWVLIGVMDDGSLNSEWHPPTVELVDRIRQALRGQVDPLPAFAARVVEGPAGSSVGVVRVYESSDTPHVLKTGQVLVREPAEDRRVYVSRPVATNFELASLISRGQLSRARTDELLRRTNPTGSAGLAVAHGVHSRITLALAPLTLSGRWRDWPTTSGAAEAMTLLLEGLGASAETVQIRPRMDGLDGVARTSDLVPWTPGGAMAFRKLIETSARNDGLLTCAVSWLGEHQDGLLHWERRLGEGGLVVAEIEGLLGPLADSLGKSELLGRYAARIKWDGFGTLFRIDPHDRVGGDAMAHWDASGDLVVDGDAGQNESISLAHRWARVAARGSGVPVWDA